MKPKRHPTIKRRVVMSHLPTAAALVILFIPAMVGLQEPLTSPTGNTPKDGKVFNTESVKEPGKAAAEQVDIHKSDHMVTRVMRLAPGVASTSGHASMTCKRFQKVMYRHISLAIPLTRSEELW
jgi:hypothetical protein